MNKKALVLAIGAAITAGGAFAQRSGGAEPDSVVVLYGKVYPELIWPSGSGATPAGATTCTICGTPTGTGSIVKRTEMESANSRFGVRGYERLGANLRAIYQLETQFHVDSNDTGFARRNSFVGLAGKSWGTVKLGRMDTPFKTYGLDLSVLGVSSGNFVSPSEITRKTGFGTNSASSFHLRRQNAVQYESPSFGGVEFAVQYSTDEADTATRKPKVISGGVSYERGPLYVAMGYEQHTDLFGGSRNVRSTQSNFANQGVNSKDRAWEATVKFKIGKDHVVEADYFRKEYKERGAIAAGRFVSYKNDAWYVAWQAKWGPRFATHMYYIRGNDGECVLLGAPCMTAGLASSQWTAGAAYYFSRRTYLFFLASLMRNGYSARYNNSNLQDPSIGEDIRQVAVGVHTSF